MIWNLSHRRAGSPRALHWFVFTCAAGALSCTGAPKRAGETPSPGGARRVLDSPAGKTRPAAAIARPPRGPFGYSMVTSSDGKPTPIKGFEAFEDCADCHPRQWKELEGSMHGITHKDTLYRRVAELARAEAGEEVYAYCSGCHTPQGVTSGLVPGTPEDRLPAIVKAGLVCDTCHQTSALSGATGPWGEPGNASIVLRPDPDLKHGPLTGNDGDAEHGVKSHAFFQRSEFCASCHTVIHPLNGVRLEHTYDEWKKSVYAKKGVQCQDCHMRTVAQASKVARTLKPIVVQGKSYPEAKIRPIAHHSFGGANASAGLLGGKEAHGQMAADRLRSAARLEIRTGRAAPGEPLRVEVAVTNVGAGHNLPTSLTELREMWVDLTIASAAGRVVFRSGALDRNGDIDPRAMRFGAKGGDKNGKLTYKPWEVTHFLWKRLIAPKATARDEFLIPIPRRIQGGAIVVTARLLYRSAPPVLVRALFPKKKLELKTVEMARATKRIPLR